MSGLDLLGAEVPKPERKWHPIPLSRGALSIAAGVSAALLYPRHWLLAALNTTAAVNNALAVRAGDRTWKEAARRFGAHVVATAGSLSMPRAPWFSPGVGYVAGAVAADLLIDGDGGGIFEEWADRAKNGTKKESAIDAQVVDADFTDGGSKALVKR